MRHDAQSGDIYLVLANEGFASCTLIVTNSYGHAKARCYPLASGVKMQDHWPLTASSNWYDLSISDFEELAFFRRFAGHVETG